jgi:hypothetical protein
MKQTLSRPIILTMPGYERPGSDLPGCNAKPRILRFPGRRARGQSQPAESTGDSDDALGAVRERLFRMIIATEWDRSNGNRAS